MIRGIPSVSIVGRQNVGKSTLFNAIINEKRAIVDEHPGLTRDILSFRVSYKDYSFEIKDTPGLDLAKESELSENILENARRHLQQSDLILLLLETPAPRSFDADLVQLVRKLNVPAVVAVNKMDHPEDMDNLVNFYELGISEFIPISALRKKNLPLMMDKIISFLPQKNPEEILSDHDIAIVGRPNSGKSTLLNAFIGYDRSVVSDIPGTTRDSVDEIFKFKGQNIRIIDTAGMRRKRRIQNSVEYYSLSRTIDSIKRCDVAVHLIDATMGITETDKKISDEIIKAHRPTIIAINKWDAIEKDDKTFDKFKDRLIFKYYRAADFPIISISASNKTRIHKLLETACDLHERAEKRIETAKLNKMLEQIQRSHAMPLLGDTLKIYYATQVDTVPPHIKLFVNNPELFKRDVKRFIEKTLQEKLNWKGIPVVLSLEGKKR
ncbi:MAG: ribosome biogenesis GTPase Der [Spirochaetota bacterium]